MGSPTAAEQLAGFVANLRFDDLPPQVAKRAKELILDTVGVSLAARSFQSSKTMVSLVRSLGGRPESTLLGTADKVPACNAALAGGTMAHALDYDDTQLPSQAHLSSSVVPSALSAAEAAGASGKATIAAAVAGWEVGLRVGSAAPGRFNDGGYHSTAICGAFGSVAAFGSLLGLSQPQLACALGIAGSQASGIMAFLDDPSWVKQMHPGWAAHSGAMAAMLAQQGFTGPTTVFEGRFGLYRTHVRGEFDPAILVAGLGEEWEMLRISMKPYPSGHFNHPFMDAALFLRQSRSLNLSEIESIHCKIAERAIDTVCEPLAVKKRPPDGYASKFSLPFSVAVVLVTGRGGLAEFSDAMARDPLVLELASKVSYSIDAESDFPIHYPGWVIVKMRDGTIHERREPIQRGALERPMAEEVVVAKFRDCAGPVLGASRTEAVIDTVLKLERQPGVSGLLALCGA